MTMAMILDGLFTNLAGLDSGHYIKKWYSYLTSHNHTFLVVALGDVELVVMCLEKWVQWAFLTKKDHTAELQRQL